MSNATVDVMHASEVFPFLLVGSRTALQNCGSPVDRAVAGPFVLNNHSVRHLLWVDWANSPPVPRPGIRFGLHVLCLLEGCGKAVFC